MRHIQEIDMNELIVANVNKYAKMLAEKKYLQSGYIAVREEDGIVITNPRIDYTDVKEENLTFVNDKNIETLEGNFRAAAVILFCAIRQDKEANAAAIVDSDSTVEFSKKRKTLMPILDDMAQVCGVSIKCAQKNVASDVVAALSGQRNCCLLPEAGAVVTGRTLDEVFTATLVLDKACNAEILAESKGGTQHMSAVAALLEHVVFKLKYSKTNQKQQKAAESGETEVKEEKQTAVVTDEEKKIAQDIKDAGVRLLDENLVQGTWGNIGVKLDDKFYACNSFRHRLRYAQARANGKSQYGNSRMDGHKQSHQRKRYPRDFAQRRQRHHRNHSYASVLRLHPRRNGQGNARSRKISRRSRQRNSLRKGGSSRHKRSC